MLTAFYNITKTLHTFDDFNECGWVPGMETPVVLAVPSAFKTDFADKERQKQL